MAQVFPMTFLIFFFLIGLNVVFVLLEYSLVRARPSRIELLARKGDSRARRVQEMLAHLDEYLAAIQVGITLVALALGAFAEPGISRYLGSFFERLLGDLPDVLVSAASISLALGALVYFQIVLGELVPRAIAIHRAEAIALSGSWLLRLLARLLRLPVIVMSSSSKLLVRLLGLKPTARSEPIFSEEELRILLGETQDKGVLPFERLLLLENLLDLGSSRARDAMTPRGRISHLSLAKTWEENLETIRSRRHSRYPLCRDTLDSMIGYVHVKDIALQRTAMSQSSQMLPLRRDIVRIREEDPLEKLLKQFLDRSVQMAAVQDGQQKIVGLLTLEDIFEEIVGEVHDEFDLPGAWSVLDFLVPGAVSAQMEAESSERAISELVKRLAAAEPSVNEGEALKAALEREKKLSSAIGNGIAIPHARLASISRPFIAVGRFLKAVPFSPPDKVPVRLVFLILTPAEAPLMQLKVLSRLASLLDNENVRLNLVRSRSTETLLDTLNTADTLRAV